MFLYYSGVPLSRVASCTLLPIKETPEKVAPPHMKNVLGLSIFFFNWPMPPKLLLFKFRSRNQQSIAFRNMHSLWSFRNPKGTLRTTQSMQVVSIIRTLSKGSFVTEIISNEMVTIPLATRTEGNMRRVTCITLQTCCFT